MKYLKKFDNHAAYAAALSTLELPNVSIDGEHVHYNPVQPPKKKYIVAISMIPDGYVSPIVDVNSQVINSNINRVYYCDQNTLMPLVDPSNMASVFNIDPIEQGFDYIEGNDLQSLNYGGQQFPAGTVFFYELEDDSYIEDYMFYGQVFAIYVPDTITSIGDYAFYTEGMNQIGMESETPPEKQEHSFDITPNRPIIVFTQTASEAYCSAWGLVVVDEQNGIYILGAPLIPSPIEEPTDPSTEG